MATTRQRRAGANPPAYAVDADGDRVYTEDDYAAADSGPIPDEWENTREVYPASTWTGADLLPDEAFSPDDDEQIDEAEWVDRPADQTAFEMEEAFFSRFSDSDAFDDDGDPLADDLLTEQERQELRRSHWQLITGLADFAGVILGTAAILVIVTLLVSLLNWLINDLSQSFILLQKNF